MGAMSEFPARLAETIRGRGLVATRDLGPGTVVARFVGPVMPLAAVLESEMRYVLWLGDGDRWMVPLAPARYMNHGCEPNCALRDAPGDADSCEAVTLRPVAAGDELTFAYNLVDAAEWASHGGDPLYRFWHESWSFDCLCGAPSCQGRIDGYRVVKRTGG